MDLARHIHTPWDPSADPGLEYTHKAVETLKTINSVDCAGHVRLRDINSGLLADNRFTTWPGATKKHHAYPGGLVVHTMQVWTTVEAMLLTTDYPKHQMCEAFTACLWHDCGKIWDFEPEPIGSHAVNLAHRDLIRHVARSYAEFMHVARMQCGGVSEQEMDRIGHAILAHHGRKEWGSPVEPRTTLAWCVHTADMFSAHYTMNGGDGVPA